MNFALFESMSLDEARDHLQGFLDNEHVAVRLMEPAAERAGVEMDYSLDSLPSFLKWVISEITIARVPVPATEPKAIRDYHKNGLIDFPAPSAYFILRAAYYMGECFVRTNGALSWTIGNPEYIQKNMPVVGGFRSEKELAPIMVCMNVFARILGDGAPESHIHVMVQTWVRFIP